MTERQEKETGSGESPSSRRMEKRARRSLDRLHARGDRAAKRGLLVLGGILLAVLIVIVVAVRAARDDEATEVPNDRGIADTQKAGPTPSPLPERRKIARLAEVEGRLFWPLAPGKERGEDDDVWDGEGVASDEQGGGEALFFAGGHVEFGPNSILKFGDGEDLLFRFVSGFAAIDFGKSLPKGRVDVAGIVSLMPTTGLRLVMHSAPAVEGSPRCLYLHVRRGSGHLRFGEEEIALSAGVSFGFQVDTGDSATVELSRLVYVRKDGDPPHLEVVEAGRRIELEGPRRLQALMPETRVLARDLIDQAKGLGDGERVGVDMYDYLNEKGILDGGLAIEGGEAGDVEATIRLTRGGETLIESTLASLAEKQPDPQKARFNRLLEARLLPVIGGEEEQTLLLYELKTETLELFARDFVRISEDFDGRKILLRPNILGHQGLMLRAIARAIGCVIVDAGDYGVELVPESD